MRTLHYVVKVGVTIEGSFDITDKEYEEYEKDPRRFDQEIMDDWDISDWTETDVPEIDEIYID